MGEPESRGINSPIPRGPWHEIGLSSEDCDRLQEALMGRLCLTEWTRSNGAFQESLPR